VAKRESAEDSTLQGATPEYRPSGAIFVTTLVTVVTLILWFGTYIFNLVRS
jgi:hypothetical protein